MSGYYASILQGALLTVGVSLAALVFAVLLGLVGAAAKLSGRPVLVALATLYTTLVRGVPELVLMLLIFYGGQIAINRLAESQGWGYIDIPPFAAGVLTIGFIFGAYLTETFRGAILAVPKGQAEAGAAFAQEHGLFARDDRVRDELPFLEGDRQIIKRLDGDRRAVFGTHFFSSSAVNHAKYTNPPCMVGSGSLTFVLSLRR